MEKVYSELDTYMLMTFFIALNYKAKKEKNMTEPKKEKSLI